VLNTTATKCTLYQPNTPVMTLDWPEAAGSAAHSYVCSPRPLSGVFDLDCK